MIILLFFLGVGRADILFSRRYAMTTSTALDSGEEEHDHLEDDGLGHGHLDPAVLVFFAAYKLKEDLGLTLSFLGLERQTSSSLEDMPRPHPQLSTEVWKKMTMVITLSFLGLERQSSSSLEDDGIGHGHLHNSSLRKGGR